MPPRYEDSVNKIIFTYFAAISKVPFDVSGTIITPKPLKVSPTLARKHVCGTGCGGCCLKLSLDYIKEEKERLGPPGVKWRTVEFNKKPIRVWTDFQRYNTGDRCRYLSLETGLCDNYLTRAFSCDFELIRFYMGKTNKFNLLGQGPYGRKWQLTRFDGGEVNQCKFKTPHKDYVAETIQKLGRLKQWADYFGLTETWVPEIIDFLESGRWEKGLIVLK